MESNQDSKLIIQQSFKMIRNEFDNSLNIVNLFINKKGLKQKAFMRAITAALLHGVVPEDTKHNFQTEEEAMMAATLAKLMDLKQQIIAFKQHDALKENTNG